MGYDNRSASQGSHTMRRVLGAGAMLFTLGCAGAPAGRRASDGPPAFGAITEADLRRDLEAMASDAMRGREAGTLDEMRASAWVAERAREAGLEPAGDDGTFFQFWPMRRMRLAPRSQVVVGGATLTLELLAELDRILGKLGGLVAFEEAHVGLAGNHGGFRVDTKKQLVGLRIGRKDERITAHESGNVAVGIRLAGRIDILILVLAYAHHGDRRFLLSDENDRIAGRNDAEFTDSDRNGVRAFEEAKRS